MSLSIKDFETAAKIFMFIENKWRRFSIFKIVLVSRLRNGRGALPEEVATAARCFADTFEEDGADDDAEILKLLAEAEEARK